MSSSDFSKVLIRDERLDCADSIPFAVYRSGSNVTVSTFEAISKSSSSITFNVQVPSETTVIDRRVIWESEIEFDITFTSGPGVTQPVMEYGEKQAFCPWPMHTLCNTMQATINNNSVTQNTADIIAALSRMHDMRELQRYNGMTCLKPDNYSNYSDGVATISNVLAANQNVAIEGDYKPRAGILANLSAVNASGNFSTSSINRPSGPSAAVTYHVVATFREPLLFAPFIYTNPMENGQGFYGIQNMNFVFNLNANGGNIYRMCDNRAYGDPTSSANQLYNNNVAPTMQNLNIITSRLIFNFLTPKPSDLLAARNVVQYWEMPRYIKASCLSTLQNTAYVPNALATVPPPFPTESVQSQSLQLNQVPDKLIVFFRPSNPTLFDTNRSLIIEGISINWNNQSGILASATQDQLWRYSVEAGSIQTWEEFSGVLQSRGGVGNASAQYSPSSTLGTNCFNNQLPSVGSYLMLDFAKHINLSEDYYAPGSLGNFNLQFTVRTASNFRPGSGRATLGQMDLVICTVLSGVFVTEKGQSATYTGVLTKDDVLSAASQRPESDADARRLVGGFMNIGSLANLARKAVGTISKYAPLIKTAASFAPQSGRIGKIASAVSRGADIAQQADSALGKGRSGGMKGMGRGSSTFNIEDRLY